MNSVNFSSIQDACNYTSLNKDKGFVIFTSYENVLHLSSKSQKNVILCSTAGEYTSKGYKNDAITGFEYDLYEAEIVEILYPPIKSINKLKSAYQKVENNENAFALLLCDGLAGMEEAIVTTFFFTKDKFKLIGGSAGDNLKFKETLVYIGNKKVHSAVIFFNCKRKTHLVKENIYAPTGKSLLVTDSNVINRTVKTFNGKPASSEYAKALGISETDLPNHFMNNPLGKFYKDDIYIASPMKVNSDKSITFYCQIIPNTFVQILHPVDPIEKIKGTLGSLNCKPNFILSIHCILRSLKFQEENLWSSFDKQLLSFCPNTNGFVSYGEQFYKNHVNQTMVMLIIE